MHHADAPTTRADNSWIRTSDNHLLLVQETRSSNKRLNSVTGLPAPLRIVCRLTSGNR